MKKTVIILICCLNMLSHEEAKTILPGRSDSGLISLKKFSHFTLDTQQLESRTPPSQDWHEMTTLHFKVSLDFTRRKAIVDYDKIQQARELEKVHHCWPRKDLIKLVVKSQKERVLTRSKMECPILEEANFTDPITLDAFGYLLTIKIPEFLPKDCFCHGLLINPESRTFVSELQKTCPISFGANTSLHPAFSAIFATKYRLLLLSKID